METDELLQALKPIFSSGWHLGVQPMADGNKWFVGNGQVCCGYHDTATEAMKVAIETLTPDSP